MHLRPAHGRAHRPPRRRASIVVAVLALVVLAAACQPPVIETPVEVGSGPAPGSMLAGCDQAGAPLALTSSTHLDPACTYVGPVTISTSNVTLDCQGAHVENVGVGGAGILVTTPVDTDLSGITVRNCFVKGFTNGIRVTRAGFRTLAAGVEYDHGYSDVLLENNHLYRTGGSGVFVDGYVTGVTIRDLDIQGAGSVGIYLEAGSRGTTVEDSRIIGNGYKDTAAEGVPFDLGSFHFRYISTGREGIAIDGSRDNVIRHNHIANNANGGVLLYENCGEYVDEKPGQWFERRYGANDNLIEDNEIVGGPVGVWVGSRMSQNTILWDCSDPAYLADGESFLQVSLDHAERNVIRGNHLSSFGTGVRVEDDDTVVEGNDFHSSKPGTRAVEIGTAYRADTAVGMPAHPVQRTVVRDNVAQITGNPTPYAFIPGADVGSTTFTGNTADDGSGSVAVDAPAAASQPPLDTFLLVRSFWRV